MLWNEVVKLVSIVNGTNSIGDTINIKTENQVFANKKSVKRTEYYQAMQNGLKPEVVFEIKAIDYADEAKLVYNSKEYNIIRTYLADGEITELVCSRVVNG